MTKEILIKYMTDRFLGWQIPENFNPDAGIAFTRNIKYPMPTGTNLLDAVQAEQMIRYLLQGAEHLPTKPVPHTCANSVRNCGVLVYSYDDDKSEIWHVTDGDEQQKWHCYEVSPGHWMCDLLETTPAAPALCGQAERDARLIELTTDNSLIYYGPYPCPACRRTICRIAKEQGVEAFDYPVGPIYPNTNWTIHDCQRVPAAPQYHCSWHAIGWHHPDCPAAPGSRTAKSIEPEVK